MTCRRLRFLSALGALVVLAVAMAACGNAVPGNAVATVAGQSITKASFDHWLPVMAKRDAQQAGASMPVAVPRPPDYSACVAQLRAAAARAPGAPKRSDADYRKGCAEEYRSLSDQVVAFLTSARWVEGEAAEQGIKASDADVSRELEAVKMRAGPQFPKLLAQAGLTVADLRAEIRTGILSSRLADRATAAVKATPAEVRAYYQSHRDQFGRPATRDLRVLMTTSSAQAAKAKRAISHGTSFAAAVRRYSANAQSKRTGGRVAGLTRQQLPPQLAGPVFSARKGQVVGPIQGPSGYFLVQVTRVRPGSHLPFAKVEGKVRMALLAQRRQSALSDFRRRVGDKWRARTTCRKGYMPAGVCRNGPKRPPATPAPSPVAPSASGGAAPGAGAP